MKTTAQHRACPKGEATEPPRRGTSLLVSTALAAACVVVGLSAAGGTYALFNASATLPGATIQAGTMSLQINGAASSTLPTVEISPDTSTVTAFTVTNVGDVTSTLSASITATTSQAINPYTRARLTPVANAGACVAGLGGTQGTLPGYAVTTLDSLTAGRTKTYCLERSLDSSTPVSLSGQSVSFTLTMSTKQKQ